MKNRKINFIKLGIFLFGISILLWNCEKESNQIDQNIDGVNVNSIIVEEFRVNENNNNPVFKSILTKLNSNSRKHKLKNNLLNFNIDSSKVKKIIFNGKTTYTLFVESETTEENSFDNLIIEIDSLDKARAFIVKYLPKNKITHYKEHNSYDFEGTRVLTEIDFNSNFLLKNSSLKTEVNCWFEVWCYHEYAHFAGASCQNTELQIVCSVSSGGNTGSNGGDSSNGGDPDNGDSETGGGANNNDDDDDDAIITAPIIKLEVCEDGKIYNETTKKCECPKGMVEDSTGNCVEKPCAGDPVANPEIAPQLGPSGMSGGLHGTCTRSGSGCPGNSSRKMHDGVDLKNAFGAPVFAMYDGTATLATQYKNGIISGAGHHVSITSTINGETVRNVYFHLQEARRTSGTINAGDIIGYQGVSGNLGSAIAQESTTSHVHIKTRVNRRKADPLDYLATTINPNTGQPTNPCN